MLATMRNYTNSFLSKALMLFLVLSFGVWGIGDMFRGGAGNAVASVGDVEISPQSFDLRMRRLRDQLQGLPPEMAQSQQFKLQVLQGMVQQALLTQEAARAGLAVDEGVAVRLIAESPDFQGGNGKFDAGQFKNFLRANGMSEGAFVETLRQDTLTQLVADSLELPEELSFPTLAAQTSQAMQQTRAGELFIVQKSRIARPAAPTEKQLAAFYETVKSEYTDPETRTIEYLVVEQKALDSTIAESMNEETLRARYEQEKDQLTSPETREVIQYRFADKDAAEAGYTALSEGKTPDAKGTSLGKVVKDALPAEAADAVFASTKPGVAKPVETAFGWQVFVVKSITPGKTPEFASVKEKLRETLIAEQREEEITNVSNALEDALAAGDSLDAAAKALKLEHRVDTLTGVTQKNSFSDDTKAAALSRGFALGESENSPLEALANGKLMMVSVREITPETPKALESIAPLLRERYIRDAHARSVAEAAREAAKALKQGKPAENGYRQNFGAISLSQARAQNSEAANMPPALTQMLFTVKLGETTDAYPLANGDWAIAKVTQIKQSTTKSEAKADTSTKRGIGGAVLSHAMRSMADRVGVHINPAFFEEPKE
jgi:peptidyl-prolyl cis-trans isomerase D